MLGIVGFYSDILSFFQVGFLIPADDERIILCTSVQNLSFIYYFPVAALVRAYSYEQPLSLQFGKMLLNRLGGNANQFCEAISGMTAVFLDGGNDFLPNYLSDWIIE